MQVEGFKCFNEDLTNRYGKKFEVGFSYHLDGNIIFGNSGKLSHVPKF